MDEKTSQISKESKPSLLTDFYIDFLGSLVPGLLAVVVTAMQLVCSASVLFHSICFAFFSREAGGRPLDVPTFMEQVTQLRDIGLGPSGNIGMLIVASYVLGSIFYRQDPKIPDHKSARKIWRDPELSMEDRNRLAVQPRHDGTDVSVNDAQFPYFFLREYLEGRGLKHLAKWISWSRSDENSYKNRTKMVINILKIRLQFLLPERCKDIIRNEAHVRMATSVWYATIWLIVISVIAITMAAIATVLSFLFGFPSPTILGVLGFDIFIIFFAFFIKLKIEKFLHYLRVREIVYVLETADFANRNGYHLYPEDFAA